MPSATTDRMRACARCGLFPLNPNDPSPLCERCQRLEQQRHRCVVCGLAGWSDVCPDCRGDLDALTEGLRREPASLINLLVASDSIDPIPARLYGAAADILIARIQHLTSGFRSAFYPQEADNAPSGGRIGFSQGGWYPVENVRIRPAPMARLESPVVLIDPLTHDALQALLTQPVEPEQVGPDGEITDS